MNATQSTESLRASLARRGVTLSFADAETLRRAQCVLRGTAEAMCGTSGPNYSRVLERDEATGKPFLAYYGHDGKVSRFPVPDREKGALRRVAEVCARNGLIYYHQTDPRGCALYVGKLEWLQGSPAEQVYPTHLVACMGGQ
jgi:hypothetical protein